MATSLHIKCITCIHKFHKMTAEERKSLKEKILENIVKFEAQIKNLEEATKPISPENSLGRVSRMDAINNKGVAQASLHSARKRLVKLKISLEKIEDSDFGNCANCGNPIQSGRLMFMPESSNCVRCAR